MICIREHLLKYHWNRPSYMIGWSNSIFDDAEPQLTPRSSVRSQILTDIMTTHNKRALRYRQALQWAIMIQSFIIILTVLAHLKYNFGSYALYIFPALTFGIPFVAGNLFERFVGEKASFLNISRSVGD
jgi:hypothetical protein